MKAGHLYKIFIMYHQNMRWQTQLYCLKQWSQTWWPTCKWKPKNFEISYAVFGSVLLQFWQSHLVTM